MNRWVAVVLMVAGVALGVVGLVVGYTMGVIADNPLAEDGVSRSQVRVMALCVLSTVVIGGVVALLGLVGVLGRRTTPGKLQESRSRVDA
ncbi:hypothetical protein [Cellulosimicrobium protaetiae]|uniref:hypothetical protein n=1 Tax=Cellulosimicrobium protaetiae TaxID=2587808 RepID=UPI001C102B24|nr:hypothetical protein [Cellulosimicrobium protaetiae]